MRSVVLRIHEVLIANLVPELEPSQEHAGAPRWCADLPRWVEVGGIGAGRSFIARQIALDASGRGEIGGWAKTARKNQERDARAGTMPP